MFIAKNVQRKKDKVHLLLLLELNDKNNVTM